MSNIVLPNWLAFTADVQRSHRQAGLILSVFNLFLVYVREELSTLTVMFQFREIKRGRARTENKHIDSPTAKRIDINRTGSDRRIVGRTWILEWIFIVKMTFSRSGILQLRRSASVNSRGWFAFANVKCSRVSPVRMNRIVEIFAHERHLHDGYRKKVLSVHVHMYTRTWI